MCEGEAAPRIATLDIIRGVAVMGIFSVNVVAFAMPINAYFNPAAYGGTTGADLALWALNSILIDGKMRGLFTLLFGASMLLIIERAQAKGLSAANVHYRRMAWLLIFGLAHYYLIWFGDILSLYAAVGLVAYWFHKCSTRTLLLCGLGFLALDLLFMTGIANSAAGTIAAAQAPGATPAAIARAGEALWTFKPLDPKALAADLALNRAGYAALLNDRLTVGLLGPLYQLKFGAAETLGSILLGMAALKAGFLSGQWPDRLYRSIAVAGIAIGAAGYAALAWRTRQAGFDGLTVFTDFFILSPPFRLVMMFGYAALIILLARGGGRLAERIAATGRMAFSNYVGASVLAAAFFQGLGLYGYLGRFETWLFAPVTWALMLIWSRAWLDRFQYGPLEWLWRSLARWSLQPMRRPAEIAV